MYKDIIVTIKVTVYAMQKLINLGLGSSLQMAAVAISNGNISILHFKSVTSPYCNIREIKKKEICYTW